MVHLFSLNGYNIALDSASGAVHALSDVCYTLLLRLNPPTACGGSLPQRQQVGDCKGGKEEQEAHDELMELYNEGLLFSEDINVAAIPNTIIKSMCLHISHDCNLRCKYCFAGTGDFNHGRSLMSYETGKKAIDFLMRKSGKIHNLEIDFFGGEPMMNFDVVKQIVEYGREVEKVYNKNIRFTLTTNGTLLNDENIDYINENISNIVLSLDGRKTVNDSMRGNGTYDRILNNYKKLVDKRDKDYYIRGTFTRNNLDFTDDVLHIAEQGFEQISVEPVVLDYDSEYSLRKEDLPKIFAEYEKLALEIIEKQSFNFFHFMIDLDAGPCLYKRVKGCGSGSEYVAVTPDGDIYPCHQFVGYNEYKMGNVWTDEFDTTIQKTFANNNITTIDECSECWAKYYCGGGCAANNYKFNQKINVPYHLACELEKKRVECALMIKAALAEE